MVFRKTLGAALMAATFFSLPVMALEDSLQQQESIDKSAAASQKRIDNLADQATDDLQNYRIASQRLESLTIYNQQMEKLIASQKNEIASIQKQTAEIDNIETGALPLMLKMTETLEQLLAADVPFLKEERQDRVANLRSLIDRADVTAGEKYRRIMEAYLVEVEYGRTIEAYRGELVVSDEARTVDFLRIGRVGLYYQTLDGNESGRWNNSRGAWELLDSGYRTSVRDGLRIARKQTPPELLTLPVNAPAQ
jgi:hypothetical protein